MVFGACCVRFCMKCCRRLGVALSSIVTAACELILSCSVFTIEGEEREGLLLF